MFDSPQDFGQALHTFLNDEQVVNSILMENILNGELADFYLGGCRIYAEGLQEWMCATPAAPTRWGVRAACQLPQLGPFGAPPIHTRRVAVVSRWYHPKHVVVEVEGFYIDAAGVHSREALLARCARWGPRLVSCSSLRLTRYRIIADRGASHELALSAARQFGAFQQARKRAGADTTAGAGVERSRAVTYRPSSKTSAPGAPVSVSPTAAWGAWCAPMRTPGRSSPRCRHRSGP